MPVQETPSAPNRRRLLTLTAGGALASAVGVGIAPGAAAAATKATPKATATPTTSTFVPTDQVLHLLRRATYGVTPDSEAELRTLGITAWLDRQLKPAAIADPACDAVLSRFALLPLDIAGVRARVGKNGFDFGNWDVMFQLRAATIARAVWSKRQLLEVMVDFWSNHLNIANPSSEVWDNRQVYDRMIRANAFGRFADMLKASAVSPAMLNYLDNRNSTKLSPNENYGRELMELHTVGLIYTEVDVKNAARLLTGMTVTDKGQYVYDANRHATGAVTILGFTHPNTSAQGEAAAMQLLDYLAMHPATAERIARKLCVRFVADDPPVSLVSALAKVYLDGKTAIAPVLKALFTSAEFAASVGAKVRTPYEDIVATMRVGGLAPEKAGTGGLMALGWLLEEAGQAPMAWPAPNGYPDVAAAWSSASSSLVRWNAHIGIVTGWWPNQFVRQASLVKYLLPTVPTSYGAMLDALCTRILGMPMLAEHRAALLTFLGKSATSPLKATDEALKSKFPYLVALVLDSPYFSVR